MSGSPYRYRAFGVEIASAIPLSGLPPGAGAPEVFISVGDLPAGPPGTAGDARLRHAAPGEYLCRSPQFGGYSIRRGREILLAPEFSAYREENLRTFDMLETVFIHLWLQRGAVCLHAAGVSIDGRAVLFTGDDGCGKSTLSAALARRGHDKLADDLSFIVFGPDGAPRVVPLCTRQNLTPEAMAMLGLDRNEGTKLPGEEKYSLSFLPGTLDPVPLAGIFHLSPRDTDEVIFVPLTGLEKFAVLFANIRRDDMAERLFPRGGSPMERLTLLGRSVAMTRIARPRRRCLAELADIVEELTTKGGIKDGGCKEEKMAPPPTTRVAGSSGGWSS
jgi:hypothetical protein